jgi:hypothetical protein
MASNITLTVVPAAPGWYVAQLIEGGISGGITLDDRLALDPIVAWEIKRDETPYSPRSARHGETCVLHTVEPLTIDGNMLHLFPSSMWAVKSPDGKFQIPLDGTFDTEAELIAHFKGELKHALELKAS